MRQGKVLVLLGTKAQFVKMAPVLLAMDRFSVPYSLVYTGQHSETFEAMEAAFGTRPADASLIPDFEADTHSSFLRWTIRFWLTAFKQSYRAQWRSHRIILIHGDTASTLYGAVLGKLFRMRVAHIEAGLRSTRLLDPFPEEIIRRLVSKMTTIHYCPDDWACANLRGANGTRLNTEGNTLFDSLQLALEQPDVRGFCSEAPDEEPYGIVSMHRNENLSRSRRFKSLISIILRVADDVRLKFVMHPATRKRLARSGWLDRLQEHENIHLLDRMDYFRFVALLANARFLMTDGGSNQEEAAELGIPCLLLRKSTERRDGLGTNVELSNLDPDRIASFVRRHRRSAWGMHAAQNVETSPSRIIAESLRWELDR